MTTLGIAALTVATLLYVLWPLVQRPPRATAERRLPLEDLEAPTRERER